MWRAAAADPRRRPRLLCLRLRYDLFTREGVPDHACMTEVFEGWVLAPALLEHGQHPRARAVHELPLRVCQEHAHHLQPQGALRGRVQVPVETQTQRQSKCTQVSRMLAFPARASLVNATNRPALAFSSAKARSANSRYLGTVSSPRQLEALAS